MFNKIKIYIKCQPKQIKILIYKKNSFQRPQVFKSVLINKIKMKNSKYIYKYYFFLVINN